MNKTNTFVCINLNDFHNNQKGAKTNAEMIFIDAKDEKDLANMTDAELFERIKSALDFMGTKILRVEEI